jgi:hypothetical protein
MKFNLICFYIISFNSLISIGHATSECVERNREIIPIVKAISFAELGILIANTSTMEIDDANSKKHLGTCELRRSSEESGKLVFHDGIYTQKIINISLEKCIEIAESKLGTIEKMKTILREDDRYITAVFK